MVNNTKYGSGALQQNTTGINNTAIGAYAGYNNLDASNNTAVGSNTAFFNTSGSNNTSLGAGSLCNNTSGSLNTAIGSSALEGVLPIGPVGDQNTAIGAQALYTNQGDLNTAVGAYSALGLTGGSYNTFLGANTSATQPNFNYSTAIGYNATVDASNQIMMGGDNGSGAYPTIVIPGLANYTTYNPGSYIEETLVPKQYVDQFVSGISIKKPVTAISETDVTGTYSSVAPGSITAVTPNPLVIDGITIQDGSGVLLNGQTDPSHNGVYTWSPGSSILTRRTGMQNGQSAVSSYVFVKEGIINAKTAWVQTNNPAIVGDSSLNFIEFSNFDYELGRGLEANNYGGLTTIDVDTSLNFVNFLDSTIGVSGANGTLALGTFTTNKIIIGPTGTSVPIQAQSIIQAQQGITGGTGSFSYLNSSNNTYLATTSGRVGVGKTSANYELDVSGNFRVASAIAGEFSVGDSSSNFNFGGFNPNKGVKVYWDYPYVGGGRTTFLNNGQEAGDVGGFDFYECNVAVPTPIRATLTCGNLGIGGIENPTATLDVSGNAIISGTINALSGITGATGSFTYLSVGDISANRLDVYDLSVNHLATIGTSTTNLSANFITTTGTINAGGLITAQGGITGPTGSFSYLNSSNNTYLATTNGTRVGIGNISPSQALDVSGNVIISGTINALSGITGATGSFTYLSVGDISANRLDVYDLSVNHLATIGTSTTNLAANFITTTGTINAGGLITAQGGITGPTGSFSYLNSSNNTYLATTSGTRVGIGNISPSQALDVSGNVNVSGQNIDLVNSNGVLRLLNISGGNYIESGSTGLAGSSKPLIFSKYFSAEATMYLDISNQRVGINKSTAPTATLDVSGNAIISGTINALSGITGATGSFTYLSVGDISANRLDVYDLSVNHLATIGTSTTNLSANFITTTGTINAGGLITANGGITGPTGSFTNLISGTGSFTNLYVSGTGSFTNFPFCSATTPTPLTNQLITRAYADSVYESSGNLLIANNIWTGSNTFQNQIIAQQGITGGTGSFSYLNSSNNTYLATTSGTRVGVGKTSANQALDVSGNGLFSGTVTATSFNATSDYRIKEYVIQLDDKFIVDSLLPVTYKNKLTEKQDMGLIAHEVQEIYPFLVNGVKDGEDFQSVNYIGLIALLIKEVKYLKQRVKVLEDKSSI